MTYTRLEEHYILHDLETIMKRCEDIHVDTDKNFPEAHLYAKGEVMGMLQQLYNTIRSPNK